MFFWLKYHLMLCDVILTEILFLSIIRGVTDATISPAF